VAEIDAQGRSAVSRLNYLAIMCDDPLGCGDWYERWLGFEEYNRTPNGPSTSATPLQPGPDQAGAAVGEDDQERGVHHFGFQIDSS